MKRGAATAEGRLDLVGRTLARGREMPRSARRAATLLLATALIAALGVAALRIDLIRVRYGLASAVREEKALLQERREAVARVRALRDPTRLQKIARERGFVRPSRIEALPVVEMRP